MACALLGLTIGTAAGLLVRKVLPAMAVTVTAIGTIAVFTTYFRRSWVDPEVRITPGTTPRDAIGSAWSGEYGYLTPDGTEHSIATVCQTSGEPLRRCMAENGFVARYHKVYPSSDFWVFQWIETVLYLGTTAALIALILFLLRRPTTGPAAASSPRPSTGSATGGAGGATDTATTDTAAATARV